jgi:hypothetical protein
MEKLFLIPIEAHFPSLMGSEQAEGDGEVILLNIAQRAQQNNFSITLATGVQALTKR